jgi:hypothetical protein
MIQDYLNTWPTSYVQLRFQYAKLCPKISEWRVLRDAGRRFDAPKNHGWVILSARKHFVFQILAVSKTIEFRSAKRREHNH